MENGKFFGDQAVSFNATNNSFAEMVKQEAMKNPARSVIKVDDTYCRVVTRGSRGKYIRNIQAK